ncbi:MAG: AraC family transcriptional regulator [Treponema sp.]|jgi:AraC-like DNA-binding protein|nr:AraC family transcriptional regulator [Treponema sp.]
MDQRYLERKKLEPTFPFLCWESAKASFPLHWHDCFEIILVSGGSVHVSVNDAIFEASDGDVVMINSGAVHGYLDSPSETAIKGFQFDITFFDESFINMRDVIFQNPVLGKRMGEAVCVHLRQLLYRIFREYTEKTAGYQLAVKSGLYEVMLMVLRKMPGRSAVVSSSKSKQILALIFKNIGDPEFTLKEAADALNLNKFYFSHFFKNITGQSFHSYLVKTRISFAERYLRESKMSVTDIAFHSGFNSLQTFNRTFKLLTGFTPRDYRRENGVSGVDLLSGFPMSTGREEFSEPGPGFGEFTAL